MPKAATAPAATLPAPAVTTPDVLEAVPELVVDDEAVAVVSVVWLPPAPVAVAPEETADVVVVGDEELPPVAVAVAEAVEVALDALLGSLMVVEADAGEEETLDSEEDEDELLEPLLLLLLLDVVEPEDALIWNGNEYWKVEESESKLILIP